MTKLSLKYLPLLLFALITVSSCKDKKTVIRKVKKFPNRQLPTPQQTVSKPLRLQTTNLSYPTFKQGQSKVVT